MKFCSRIAYFVVACGYDIQFDSDILSCRLLSHCFATIGAEAICHSLRQIYLHPSAQSVANFKAICQSRFGSGIEEIILLGV